MAASSELTEVQKAFHESEIVPNVLKVAPKEVVLVSYPSDVHVQLDNELTPTQVKDIPRVIWNAEKGVYYTLMMIDPDAPTRKNPELGEVRHWLVMNILENEIETGDEITAYRGSGAPKGTGLHRYIFLVYKQQNGIIQHDEPRTPRTSRAHRFKTSASKLAEKYNLGDPEFGNFFQAQYDSYVDIIQAQTTE